MLLYSIQLFTVTDTALQEWNLKPKDFQAVVDVNLSGDFYVTQAFLKHAIDNKNGARIINIASVVRFLKKIQFVRPPH